MSVYSTNAFSMRVNSNNLQIKNKIKSSQNIQIGYILYSLHKQKQKPIP